MLSFPGRGDLSGSNGAGVDRGPLAPAPGKDEWNDISAPNNPDLFRSMVEDTRGGIPPTDPLPRSKREEIRSIQDAATPVGRVRDVGLDGDPDATGAQAYSADSDVPLKDDLTDVDPVDGPRSMPISDPASFGAPILSDLPSPTGGSEVSLIETVDDRALSPEPQDSFSGRGPELRPRAATVFGAPAPAQLGQSKSGAAGVDSGAPVRFESYDDTLSGQGADVPRAPPRDQIGRSHDHGMVVAVRSHEADPSDSPHLSDRPPAKLKGAVEDAVRFNPTLSSSGDTFSAGGAVSSHSYRAPIAAYQAGSSPLLMREIGLAEHDGRHQRHHQVDRARNEAVPTVSPTDNRLSEGGVSNDRSLLRDVAAPARTMQSQSDVDLPAATPDRAGRQAPMASFDPVSRLGSSMGNGPPEDRAPRSAPIPNALPSRPERRLPASGAVPTDALTVVERRAEIGGGMMHLSAGHHGPVRRGETSVSVSATSGAGAAVAGPIPTSIGLSPTRGSAEASLTTRMIAPTTRPDESSPAIPVMRRDAATTGQQALGNKADGARSIAGSAPVGQDRSLFWSAPNDASPIVPMSSGVHGTVPATSGIGPSQSATAQSSASVTWQIGQAMGTGPTTETVLKLEPEELGRVTLNLRGDERSMVLVVQAERLETLDLIRRSSQELASALSDLGYNDITFEFGGSGDHATHEGSHAGPKGGNGPDGPQDEEQATSSPGNRPGTGHVDIRI